MSVEEMQQRRLALYSRSRMEKIGRDCVRALSSADKDDHCYVWVSGPIPRSGFPRGELVHRTPDGILERLYDPEKLLAAIQRWMHTEGDKS